MFQNYRLLDNQSNCSLEDEVGASDNKEKDFVRPEFLPQALTSSYCLLAAIGREIDVFCQLDLSIVKRAL